MKEILAENLKSLFDNSKLNGRCGYKGKIYEVWEVSDKDFKTMCEMSETEFEQLCPNGMWRSSEGSSLNLPITTFFVNGKEMKGYQRDCDEHYGISRNYENLLDYLCTYIGVSSPKNICAIAVDLAKHNRMSLGVLFTIYQG